MNPNLVSPVSASPVSANPVPANPVSANPVSANPVPVSAVSAGAVVPLVAECVELILGSRSVLSGVSLSVAAGEVVAIVGPSGSGKSSLLHVCAGLLRPDSGSVVLDGVSVWDGSDRSRRGLLRDKIGMVFQFGELLSEVSLIENVSMPLRIVGRGRRESERLSASLLAELGIDGETAARRPGQVSGGQMQRAAIARALIRSPRVLFADEPTGALDSASGELVMQALTSAVRDRGVGCVIVTHSASVAKHADRVIELVDGHVAVSA